VTLSKKAAALMALFLAMFFALGTASASQAWAHGPNAKPAPHTPNSGDEQQGSDQQGQKPGQSENELHHDQLRQQYGEVEQVFLPPLLVTDPAGKPGNRLLDSANIDPHENMPIDPKTVSSNQKTPADSFFQVATVAISTMAAGSLALGVFAIRRSIRTRNTPD
jgi:hypothetical protein